MAGFILLGSCGSVFSTTRSGLLQYKGTYDLLWLEIGDFIRLGTKLWVALSQSALLSKDRNYSKLSRTLFQISPVGLCLQRWLTIPGAPVSLDACGTLKGPDFKEGDLPNMVAQHFLNIGHRSGIPIVQPKWKYQEPLAILENMGLAFPFLWISILKATDLKVAF